MKQLATATLLTAFLGCVTEDRTVDPPTSVTTSALVTPLAMNECLDKSCAAFDGLAWPHNANGDWATHVTVVLRKGWSNYKGNGATYIAIEVIDDVVAHAYVLKKNTAWGWVDATNRNYSGTVETIGPTQRTWNVSGNITAGPPPPPYPIGMPPVLSADYRHLIVHDTVVGITAGVDDMTINYSIDYVAP